MHKHLFKEEEMSFSWSVSTVHTQNQNTGWFGIDITEESQDGVFVLTKPVEQRRLRYRGFDREVILGSMKYLYSS